MGRVENPLPPLALNPHPEPAINVFDLRDRLVADYASYTRSFIKIADPRIAAKVDNSLNAGAFRPEPLLQLNPTFLPSGTVTDLVPARGALHPECLIRWSR